MPAPCSSISNPGQLTRQCHRAKPHPAPTCLNNELSIDTTSSTTSTGPQPRPKPHLIPAPLNERLSIDTTSPMTSIHHPQEEYGHKADKLRQKTLSHPQPQALGSEEKIIPSPLPPH